jgi:hypothetical protein
MDSNDKYLASLQEIDMYRKDGRASLFELNSQYDRLATEYGFKKKPIYTISIEGKEVIAYCYVSSLKGPALWILSGVHGEESAGPNAIAGSIDSLGILGKEIPLIVMPLLNPKGYSKDWRYLDNRRDSNKGHSVSDSEHCLPDLKNKPRIESPSSEASRLVTNFVLDMIINYPPVLTLNHHEDEALERSYVYSQGLKAADDKVAHRVIDILKESGIPLQKDGVTRFGELIKDGIVVNADGQVVRDGSIDELLGSADSVIINGKIIQKPIAHTSLVIETPVINISLNKRIQAHSNILKQLRSLWALANQ